jgi:hypothetical protein
MIRYDNTPPAAELRGKVQVSKTGWGEVNKAVQHGNIIA